MLMENTIRVSKDSNLVNVFDLKGSQVDRKSADDAVTLKDINFKNMCGSPDFLVFQQRDSIHKYVEVEKDVAFLKKCGLMDYSLLIGIEVPVQKPTTQSAAELDVNKYTLNSDEGRDGGVSTLISKFDRTNIKAHTI